MTVLAAPLIRALREHAPGCSISLDGLPAVREDFESYLTRRDLVIVPLGFGFPGERQPVFTDELVCLVARGHPRLVDGALTLDDLRQMPHAVAEFAAAGPVRRPLEMLAERHGLAERNVRVTVTSLLTLPYAIAGTELCAFVPSRLAHRCLDVLDLTVARTPVPAVQITEAAHWHPRRAADPAGRWLRGLLHTVSAGLEDVVAG
jgi:DNA-binding transcriptional LysR family regulator